jgi:hypothetical protein
MDDSPQTYNLCRTILDSINYISVLRHLQVIRLLLRLQLAPKSASCVYWCVLFRVLCSSLCRALKQRETSKSEAKAYAVVC